MNLIILILCFLPSPSSISAQIKQKYTIKIVKIDKSRYPNINIIFQLVDQEGQLVDIPSETKFDIFENGKLVASKVSSLNQLEVLSVLVIDISGSMNDSIKREKTTKIEETKTAALRYIENAPKNFQLGIVFFNEDIKVIDFTKDKSILTNEMKSISAIKGTKLYEAIGIAINLLKNKQERKSIIVLTDGRENKSGIEFKGEKGKKSLIKMAKDNNVTISTIGVGDDRIKENMEPFVETGGKYLFAPSVSQINELYQGLLEELSKEVSVNYVTKKEATGLEDIINIQSSNKRDYINNGESEIENCCIIPALTNSPPNYFYFFYFSIGIVTLSTIFPILSFGFASFKIFKVRSKYTQKLKRGSSLIGRKIPYISSSEKTFKEGDQIIICPRTQMPFDIRSWRNLRCNSGRDPKKVQYNWCYQYNLPSWLRRLLHDTSAKKKDEKTGVRWLCNCAGDKEGY